MSNSVTLSAYQISIHPKNKSRSKKEKLNDFNNGTDLLELFKNLPALLNDAGNESTLVEDDIIKKRLRIKSDKFQPFGRCIHGVLESGDYGIETPLVDSKGDDVGLLDKDTAPMVPFYFLCELMEDATDGILIMSRFRQYGVFTMFSKAIRDKFTIANEDFTLDISPIVSFQELQELLKKADVKKASFISTDPIQFQNTIVMQNVNDQFDYQDVYLEVNLVARKNKSVSIKNSLLQIMRNIKVPLNSYFKIGNIDYSKIKIQFQLNGKSYTMDTSRLDNFSPDIDISDKVKFATNTGLPIMDDVKEQCLILLDDLKTQLKL